MGAYESFFLKVVGGSLLIGICSLMAWDWFRESRSKGNLIKNLQSERDEANERADLERSRADNFAKERNEAIALSAGLKQQVLNLIEEVEYLESLVLQTASLVEVLIEANGGRIPADKVRVIQENRMRLSDAARKRRANQDGRTRASRSTDMGISK